jgi:hypothetical protein
LVLGEWSRWEIGEWLIDADVFLVGKMRVELWGYGRFLKIGAWVHGAKYICKYKNRSWIGKASDQALALINQKSAALPRPQFVKNLQCVQMQEMHIVTLPHCHTDTDFFFFFFCDTDQKKKKKKKKKKNTTARGNAAKWIHIKNTSSRIGSQVPLPLMFVIDSQGATLQSQLPPALPQLPHCRKLHRHTANCHCHTVSHNGKRPQ